MNPQGSNLEQPWRLEAGRVHGRLAILYWKPGPDQRHETPRTTNTFNYPEGSIDIRIIPRLSTTITLNPRYELPVKNLSLVFDHRDWQGIIEGYYDIDGTLRHGDPWVWIGQHRIDRLKFSTTQFQSLCANAGSLLQRLRFEKETFHPWFPIGRSWGFLTIWEYFLIRATTISGRSVPRPYGNTLRNQEDFGYQTVLSPKLTMKGLRKLFRQNTSAKLNP